MASKILANLESIMEERGQIIDDFLDVTGRLYAKGLIQREDLPQQYIEARGTEIPVFPETKEPEFRVQVLTGGPEDREILASVKGEGWIIEVDQSTLPIENRVSPERAADITRVVLTHILRK